MRKLTFLLILFPTLCFCQDLLLINLLNKFQICTLPYTTIDTDSIKNNCLTYHEDNIIELDRILVKKYLLDKNEDTIYVDGLDSLPYIFYPGVILFKNKKLIILIYSKHYQKSNTPSYSSHLVVLNRKHETLISTFRISSEEYGGTRIEYNDDGETYERTPWFPIENSIIYKNLTIYHTKNNSEEKLKIDDKGKIVRLNSR